MSSHKIVQDLIDSADKLSIKTVGNETLLVSEYSDGISINLQITEKRFVPQVDSSKYELYTEYKVGDIRIVSAQV